mmetsp:Transcript_76134/g.168163  ORF Transcript_76134/g.168163 Transcript_76134/m.168163 type:complete len:204 (-) Transcript_76134:169-780(-)
MGEGIKELANETSAFPQRLESKTHLCTQNAASHDFLIVLHMFAFGASVHSKATISHNNVRSPPHNGCSMLDVFGRTYVSGPICPSQLSEVRTAQQVLLEPGAALLVGAPTQAETIALHRTTFLFTHAEEILGPSTWCSAHIDENHFLLVLQSIDLKAAHSICNLLQLVTCTIAQRSTSITSLRIDFITCLPVSLILLGIKQLI